MRLMLSLVLIIIVSIAATGMYIYYNHDKIITKALATIMASTPYPTEIQKAKINFGKDFPQLSLILNQVTIHNTTEKKHSLAFDQITCSFNIIALIRGQYIIDHVTIEEGICHLPFSTSADTINQTSSLSIPVTCPKVILKNITVHYAQESNTVATAIQHAQADIKATDQGLDVQVTADLNIQKLAYKDVLYSIVIPCCIKTHFEYNRGTKVWQIISGNIKQPAGIIHVHGSWSTHAAKPFTNLKFKIQDTAIQSLLALVSSVASPVLNEQLQIHQPTGTVTCQVHWQEYQRASLTADFTYHAGTILLPGFPERLQIPHLKGSLSLPHGASKRKGNLEVHEYMATWGDSQVKGRCNIMDFEKPILQAKMVLKINLNALTNYLNSNEQVTDLSGEILGSCDYKLNLKDLNLDAIKNETPLLTGELKTQGIHFNYNNTNLQLGDTTIVIQENGSWSISELVGKLDGKTFVCNGQLNNGNALLVGKQPSHFEAKIYADYIALDKLLSTNKKATTGATAAWWPQLSGTVICDIDEVVYKRFRGEKLRAKFQLNAQQLQTDNFVCWFAGGKIELTASLNQSTHGIAIFTKASLYNIPLGTVFYTCENFHQQFLVDQHLGGKVDSHITLSMKADKNFHIDLSSIQADLKLKLQHTVLKNFEPLKILSTYIADKELNELHFSTLQNNIRIQDRTIYIPPMQVHTSVTSIELSGTHTFDGKIDYTLVLPLHQAKTNHIAKDITAMAAKNLEGINLYLKLQGDVNNYTLSYDGKLLKEALQKSFKDQGTMLGNLFRGKLQQHLEDKTIAIDDYFDFE